MANVIHGGYNPKAFQDLLGKGGFVPFRPQQIEDSQSTATQSEEKDQSEPTDEPEL